MVRAAQADDDVLVYDDLVLFVAMKPEAEIASKRELKAAQAAQDPARLGADQIFPQRREHRPQCAVSQRARGDEQRSTSCSSSVPAIAGGIPILINLASTVTVLFLVVGFYLGLVPPWSTTR